MKSQFLRKLSMNKHVGKKIKIMSKVESYLEDQIDFLYRDDCSLTKKQNGIMKKKFLNGLLN